MKQRTDKEKFDNAIELAKVGVLNLRELKFDKAKTFLLYVKQELECKDNSLLPIDGVGVFYQETLDYLAGIAIVNKEYDDANGYLTNSLHILKELEKENPESPLLFLKCGATFEKLGVVYQNQGNIKKAIDAYKQGVVLANASLKKSASLEAYDLIALLYYRIAIIEEVSLNDDMLHLSLNIWSQLHDMNPDIEIFKDHIKMCEDALNKKSIKNDLYTYEILNLLQNVKD